MAYDDEQCKLVQLARERQENDLKRLPALGYQWRPDRAKRVCDFIENNLKHSKGEWAGKPCLLEDWQKRDIIYPIFGWLDPTGNRRFRVAYAELPRKNGKSTTLAGIGNYLFIADGESGAEVYSAATKKDQARIVFGEAVRMVQSSSELSEIVNCYRDNMNVVSTASKFEPLGADSDTTDGLNAHGIIIDELHAHKRRGLYDVLLTSTGARRNPLSFSITTAGYDRNSICWEVHDYSENVLKGVIEDESHFAYITTIDEGDDWKDELAWAKANPNLDITIKREYLKSLAKKALVSTEFENTFKRLHLNIWTGQNCRWLKLEDWDGCNGHFLPSDLIGRECYCGLDLSSTTDISAFVMVFPTCDGSFYLLCKFFVPEEKIKERGERDRAPYRAWSQQGHLITTPGNVIDYDRIRSEINAAGEMFDIKEIALDRWNATQLSMQLDGDGFTVVPFGQGYASMSGPAKELEKLVLGKKLKHGNHPVLRWMANNVAIEMDAAGNVKPNKARSYERIDGIVATIMGLGRATLYEHDDEAGYSGRGLIIL